MNRNEMIARARSAFREVLEAMETPHAQLLQRDPDIKGLVENIVQHVEHARNPENWPVSEYIDDFAVHHPSDKKQWAELFLMAACYSTDMADILCFMRNSGCELIRDDEYGYIIRPVIGGKGFHSMQEYEEVKQPLNQYAGALLPMLKRLRRAYPGDFVQTTLSEEEGS